MIATDELRYKNETEPKYKFITVRQHCSNINCKHHDILDGCTKYNNDFKQCNKSIAYIEVVGIEHELETLMKLLIDNDISIYENKTYPLFVYKGNKFRFFIVDNNTINTAFEQYCNKFPSVVINGRNPFI